MEKAKPQSEIWAAAGQRRIVSEVEATGTFEIFVPVSGVAVTLPRGHLSARMAQRWAEAFEPYFSRGESFTIFNDWGEMTGYDSAARSALTSWVIEHRKQFRTAHFFVSSKIVAMGVSAASLAVALTGITMVSHSTRAAFERELSSALQSARGKGAPAK